MKCPDHPVARRFVPMLGLVQANAWERLAFPGPCHFAATLPSPEPAFDSRFDSNLREGSSDHCADRPAEA
jgi:hypothetical protein